MLDCTHLVLYVKNVAVTRNFYVGTLGCAARRYAPDERFLSVSVGDFILNFYGLKPGEAPPDGYSGIAHLGLELPTRFDVQQFFGRLADFSRLDSGQSLLQTVTDLETSQTPGPYRFYVHDPDGYTLELHTWEGVEA